MDTRGSADKESASGVNPTTIGGTSAVPNVRVTTEGSTSLGLVNNRM